MASLCPKCHKKSMITVRQENYSRTHKCMDCGFHFKPVFVLPEDVHKIVKMDEKEYKEARAVLDEYYEQTQRKQYNPDNKKIIVSLG